MLERELDRMERQTKSEKVCENDKTVVWIMPSKAIADSCSQVPNLQQLAFSIASAESKECAPGDAEGAERHEGYPRLSRVLHTCGHPRIECLGIQAEQRFPPCLPMIASNDNPFAPYCCHASQQLIIICGSTKCKVLGPRSTAYCPNSSVVLP